MNSGRNKRLELTALNNNGNMRRAESEDQPASMEADRIRHSRQKQAVASSFDGVITKRVPSNNSLRHGELTQTMDEKLKLSGTPR